jgi:hypothetical protein
MVQASSEGAESKTTLFGEQANQGKIKEVYHFSKKLANGAFG